MELPPATTLVVVATAVGTNTESSAGAPSVSIRKSASPFYLEHAARAAQQLCGGVGEAHCRTRWAARTVRGTVRDAGIALHVHCRHDHGFHGFSEWVECTATAAAASVVPRIPTNRII